jgi:hypothetical protein
MNIELKTYHKITNANTGKLVADRLTKKELDTFLDVHQITKMMVSIDIMLRLITETEFGNGLIQCK